MDKYEIGLRIQEIRSAYEKKDFKKAAELAKDIDWSKIKEWIPLAMMVDVQEQVGDLEEARDMAILAYNRNLGGRKLLYRLTEIFIKLGDFDHADELFKEYSKVARHNSSKYILEYHLLRAKKAPNEEQIKVLEKFREKEIDEHYMYKLAGLYAKNGDEDKAIKICDEISLWFVGGDYVEGAVKLKKRLGGKLNDSQQKVYDAAKVREEDLERTREMTFAEQLKLARSEADSAANNEKEEHKLGDGLLDSAKPNADKDDAERFAEALKAQAEQEESFDAEKEYGSEAVFDLTPKKKSGNIFSALFKGMRNRNDGKVTEDDLKDKDLVDSSYFKDDDKKIEKIVEEKVTKSNIDNVEEESSDVIVDEYIPEFEAEQTKKLINNDLEEEKEEPDVFGDEEELPEAEEFVFEENDNTTDKVSDKDVIVDDIPSDDVHSESLISGTDDSKQISKDVSEEASEEIISEPESDNTDIRDSSDVEENDDNTEVNSEINTDDSDNDDKNNTKFSESLKSIIDGAKERLHRGYSEILNTESLVSVPEIHEKLGIHESISADVNKIMSEEENRQKLKAENNAVSDEDEQIEGQMNLSDWIEAERERKYADRHTKEFSISELERALDEIEDKSKAYDKLMEEQKRLAKEAGEPFNESVAKRNVEYTLSVKSSRTDLDIRTGKAQARNEDEINDIYFAKQEPEAEIDDSLSANNIIADIVKMGIDAPEDKLKVFAIAFADINPESINIQIDKAPKKVINSANILYDYFMGKEITDDPAEVSAASIAPAEESDINRIIAGAEQNVNNIGTVAEPDVSNTGAVEEPDVNNTEAVEESAVNKVETVSEPDVNIENGIESNDNIESDAELNVSEINEDKLSDKTSDSETPAADNNEEAKDNYEYTSIPAELLNGSTFKALDVDKIINSVSPKLKAEDTTELPVEDTAAAVSDAEAPKENEQIDIEAEDSMPEVHKPDFINDNDNVVNTVTEGTDGTENISENISENEPESTEASQTDKTVGETAHEPVTENTPPNGRIGETVVIPREAIAEAMKNNSSKDVPYQNVVVTDATRKKIMNLFEAYTELPGVSEELHEFIKDLPNELSKKDSSSGNIIITGNNMSDKTAFAKLIARAIDMIDPNARRKVVKTTGDTLNKYGFASSAEKLRGKILIIEDAASILPAVADELLQSLKQDTDRLFVILEDSDAEMEVLLKFNPEMENTFNHRIILRQYSVNELVDIFREIAKRDGYTVNDDGLLVLYLLLDKLRSKNNNVSLDDINELVERSITHAKKRSSKGGGFFGRRKKNVVSNELTDEDIKI
ncbi:tetratricopeptide repeat protein [Howardella ureilytica]